MKDTNSEKSRLQWVDLFRGVAVLWMIETHVTNTFLKGEFLGAGWFEKINYANGLVAPAFLFIAGLLLGLMSQRVDAPPQWGKKLWRVGQLLLIAYALHFSIPQDTSTCAGWIHSFTHIDILQCIAIAMLSGLVLQRFGNGAIAAGACFFIFAAPLASQVSPGGVPQLLAGYLNRLNGSLFPLFPWAGFFLAGWTCNRLKWKQCLGAASLCWLGVWLQPFVPSIYPGHDYYLAGPGFFFERLGWMLVGAALCQGIAPYFAPRLLINSGSSSLAIYVIHLQVINLFAFLGARLGMPQKVGVAATAALFIGVASFTLILTALLGLPRVAPACRWLGVRPASA